MKPIRVTAIILVLLSGLYCQQPTCRYSVPVNVTDAKTFEPLIGFGTASFQIHIGKQTLKPTAVAYRRAQRVFLFVDASGSMRSKPGRWAVVMQAAHEILATINTSVPIETEIFAESGQSFSNREEASAFLKYLYDKATKVPPLGNRTELYDDIASAVESEHIGIDDAVIIITDGGDNQSKLDESKLKRELAAHAIHPAFLLLPAESNFPPEQEAALITIPRMAEELGGFVFNLPEIMWDKSKRLLPFRFYADAIGYYQIRLETPRPRKEQLRVTLVKRAADKGRRFDVHAPHRLPTCSPLP